MAPPRLNEPAVPAAAATPEAEPSKSEAKPAGEKGTTQNAPEDEADGAKKGARTQQQQPHLLDKLGGPENLIALMDNFYALVLADPELGRFFNRIEMVTLKRHTLNIIATAFSSGRTEGKGPDSGADENAIVDIPAYLAKKHKKLFEQRGVTEFHFDRFVGHFVQAMTSLNYDAATVQEAEARLLQFRSVFEDGAAKAAEKKKRSEPSRKVRFWEEEKVVVHKLVDKVGAFYDHLASDPKLVVGACVVVGAVVTSLFVMKRKD